jgi:hypothetical protein
MAVFGRFYLKTVLKRLETVRNGERSGTLAVLECSGRNGVTLWSKK